jgi:hypothetical protein
VGWIENKLEEKLGDLAAAVAVEGEKTRTEMASALAQSVRGLRIDGARARTISPNTLNVGAGGRFLRRGPLRRGDRHRRRHRLGVDRRGRLMFGTLADLLGNANGQTPLVVIVAGVILLAAAWIGGRVFRSMQRQGGRIGKLEQAARSERIRRRQLEQCLRERGIRLPYWPDDPPELYAVQQLHVDDVDEDQADDMREHFPQTRGYSSDELAAFTRHRR